MGVSAVVNPKITALVFDPGNFFCIVRSKRYSPESDVVLALSSGNSICGLSDF